jgi:O-antigen ligase
VAAPLFALPVVATWYAGAPLALAAVSIVVFVVGFVRTEWGLMVVAALTPVATPIDVLAGAPFGPVETLQLLVAPLLAGAAARTALAGHAIVSRLLAPALVMAAVVASTAAVQWWSMPREPAPVRHALLWVEALALAVLVEHVLRTSASEARHGVLRMTAAGITAAAAMSAVRLVEVSVRSSTPFATAWQVLSGIRFSPLIADVNAAGSLFALFLVPMVCWSLVRRHVLWWFAAATVALGLWATGSRTALAAAVIGLGCAWALTARPSRRAIALGSAVVVVLAALVTMHPGRPVSTAATALSIRAGMFRIGTTLAARAPVFGLGFGGFVAESASVATPAEVAEFPPLARGKNAHNNFLQLLVELGAIGLGAFLWLVAAAARPVAARARAGPVGPRAAGLGGGLVAFLVTCLMGHPLLVAQVLMPFGIALGLMAGAFDETDSLRGGRVRRRVAAGLVAAISLSVPFRGP